MNKIYFAQVDVDVGGCYISASSIKEAKKISYKSELISEYLDNYIDLECHVCRHKDKKYKYTDLPTGIMEIEEILQEKCHWFFCTNRECEQDDYFELTDDDNCKCPKCGNVFEIPFRGM